MGVRNKKRSPESPRGYIIDLSKWHSRWALLASLVTVFCSLYAIIGSIVIYAEDGTDVRDLFHWFTTNANCLTAFSACMIIPFAVEGIRKKHFSYPKWVAMFHYSGMVCTTLTMVFSVAFMSWYDPIAAFGGYNTYLHVVCPVLVIVSFFMVESGYRYTRRDALASSLPALIYMLVYAVEVAVIGKENGGWEDLYHIMEYMPLPLAALGICLLTFGISMLIRKLYNRLARTRNERMEARLWPKDVNPAAINIEIFGLGRYMGKHADTEFIELPLSLISMIADRYDLKTEQLTKIYIRGFLDSLKDRNMK